MPKLTKSVIDHSIPKDKNYFVWDGEIKGFGCRILTGGKKTYVFYYQSPVTNKKSCVKIGCHGNITVDLARVEAKKLSASIASGIDPRKKKKEELIEGKKTISFESFWKIFTEKYIMERHQPSTIYRDRGRINKYILPYFSQKIINDITREDILTFVETLKHIKGNCTKCLRLLSVAFNQAELWGYRSANSNPCKGVYKTPEKQVERFLTSSELNNFEKNLINQVKTGKSSPYTLASIWMLLYTGGRESEILTLKWKDVHLEDGYIYLGKSKVGVRTIPLNDKAKQILNSLKKQEDNPYVFCGKFPGTHLKEIKTTWRKVRKLANISDVRMHDLRHSFASFALKKGVDLYTVSKLLGHKNIATTTRYAHLELEHLKTATNKVAEVFG